MEDKIEKIIYLIGESELDDTIKEILIRDLKSEGLSEFLRHQIIAYCVEGMKKANEQIDEAKKVLQDPVDENPAQ